MEKMKEDKSPEPRPSPILIEFTSIFFPTPTCRIQVGAETIENLVPSTTLII